MCTRDDFKPAIAFFLKKEKNIQRAARAIFKQALNSRCAARRSLMRLSQNPTSRDASTRQASLSLCLLRASFSKRHVSTRKYLSSGGSRKRPPDDRYFFCVSTQCDERKAAARRLTRCALGSSPPSAPSGGTTPSDRVRHLATKGWLLRVELEVLKVLYEAAFRALSHFYPSRHTFP